MLQSVSDDTTTLVDRFLMTLQSGSCDTLQLDYRAFVGRSLMALQSVSYDTTTDYKAFVDRFCVTLQNL